MASTGSWSARPQKETVDKPPSLANAVQFWVWHVLCWLFYALVSIVYLPWALAMTTLIGALAVPFGVTCWWRPGRQVFLYFYVITVVLPGKFLWFNLFRRNKRRGQAWDFEMGKPRATTLKDRRPLSINDKRNPQVQSSFLTKLPPEIRRSIYEQVILNETAWFNMIQGTKPGKKQPKMDKLYFKTTAHPSLIQESQQENPLPEELLRALHREPTCVALSEPKSYNHIPSALAFLCSCKQIYSEAIHLLYSLPTFNFPQLQNPPFFLQSTLPQHLAHIHAIHLVYDQKLMVRRNHIACSTARFSHKIGKCTFCNPLHWLDGIKTHLPNLRKIEIFIFLDKVRPLPSVGDAFFVRLLDLQIGPNGVREMHLKVLSSMASQYGANSAEFSESDYAEKVEGFSEALKVRMEGNVARWRREKTLGRAQSSDAHWRRSDERPEGSGMVELIVENEVIEERDITDA